MILEIKNEYKLFICGINISTKNMKQNMIFFSNRISIIFTFIIAILSAISTKRKRNPWNIHSLSIDIDYSFISKKKYFSQFHKIFEEVKNFYSPLIFLHYSTKSKYKYKNFHKNCSFGSKKAKKMIEKSFDKYPYDILLIPVISKKPEKMYKECFPESKNLIYRSVSIININYDYIKKEQIKEFIPKLKMIMMKILGFNSSKMRRKNIRNNYLYSPDYLTGKMASKKSYEKLMSLSGKIFSNKFDASKFKHNFYLKKWPKEYKILDIMSENIDIKSSLTELSLNLLREYNFYYINKCDYEFFKFNGKNICTRIDNECLNEKQMENYFINYEFNSRENKTFCYLNSDKNILNNQCGTKTGDLLIKKVDICLHKRIIGSKKNITKSNTEVTNKIQDKGKTSFNEKNQKNEIIIDSEVNIIQKIGGYAEKLAPDIGNYNYQIINLLLPDEKCSPDQPSTLFFSNDYTNFTKETQWLSDHKRNIITKNLTSKNYFLTFLTLEDSYFRFGVQQTLKSNNFIRTFHKTIGVNLLFPNFALNFLKRRAKINYHYLKISHFLGYGQITFKDLLYKNYKKFEKKFPNDYNFMPPTYVVPGDEKIVLEKFGNYTFDNKNLWLVKPQRGSLGKGIYLFNSIKDLPKKYILTKYVSNPHLLKGKKYDLRIYALVSSIAPLKIYLYKEGLVRRASENYDITKKNAKNSFIHLTNVSLNKKNSKKYQKSKDGENEMYNKWSFATYKKYLENHYPDRKDLYKEIREKIADKVIKTIICGQRKIYNKIQKGNYEFSNFFHLFGFDILFDEEFNAYVLEVNNRPQMSLFDEVDKNVKLKLIPEVLNIVGIVPYNKENPDETLDGKIVKNKSEKERVETAADESLCEFMRPTGDFERIFPLKENIKKYEKFLRDNNNEYNLNLWEKILSENNKN